MPNVYVTSDDIEKGVRNDSEKCAVDLAIARKFPDATHIRTDIQTIRFTREGKRYIYLTPYKAQEYIVAFDAGEADIPGFSVQLRDPHITEVQKNMRTRRATLEKPMTKKGTPKKTPVRAGGAPPPTAGIGSKPVRGRSKRRVYGHRGLRINRPTDG